MATEVLIALDMVYTEVMVVFTVDMVATEAAMEADSLGEDMGSATEGTAGTAATAGTEVPGAPFRLTSVDLGVITLVFMGMENESRVW